jgi:hypothetical protein
VPSSLKDRLLRDIRMDTARSSPGKPRHPSFSRRFSVAASVTASTERAKTTEITAVPTSTIAMSTGIPAFLAGTAALIGKDFAVAITLAFSTS